MRCEIDAVIFDLDGTIYLGEEPLPGSVEAVAELRRRGKQVLFVSNKPLQPRAVYAQKLTRLGIPAAPSDVITSAFVLGHHLANHLPALRYYVVGEEPLRAELRGYGLTVVQELAAQDPQAVIETAGIDAVIVAFDRTLDYRKFNTAYQALARGARFLATNGDMTCPVPGGAIPDAGATIAALEQLTGRRLELLAGKPSTLILQVALDLLGGGLDATPHRCMMIGDRLETDIRMGQEAGLLTAAVLTGVATRTDIEQMDSPPDFVLEDLGELPALIG